ncbi:MAG TPA: M67 family metallopeptidase [Vicinamibacterales bacterium]|nr:M67 family metallopeptidase [Vicinamibacterales bacterium]
MGLFADRTRLERILQRTLRIRAGALDDIVAHARESAPTECCGLLVGSAVEIVESVRAANVADDPARRFVIDPRDHIDSRRKARQRGLAVVGFYHSHPASPAEPSATDLAEAGYTDHLYMIVSLAADAPAILLFRLEGGNFRAVPFVTVG